MARLNVKSRADKDDINSSNSQGEYMRVLTERYPTAVGAHGAHSVPHLPAETHSSFWCEVWTGSPVHEEMGVVDWHAD